MNEYDVKRLAEVFAVQAEIEGMKFSNMMAEQYGKDHQYTENDFKNKAHELKILASKHNEQL